MILTKDKFVGGVQLYLLRNQLRRGFITAESISHELKIGENLAGEVLQALIAEEYIEQLDELPRYFATLLGNSVANAGLRSYKRPVVAKALALALERAVEINSSGIYAFRVKEIRTFGSYLTDAIELGDLDLAIALSPMFTDERQQAKRNLERRQMRTYRSVFDDLSWPQQEVFRVLKSRSPIISLHEIDQLTRLDVPSRVVFTADADA